MKAAGDFTKLSGGDALVKGMKLVIAFIACQTRFRANGIDADHRRIGLRVVRAGDISREMAVGIFGKIF